LSAAPGGGADRSLWRAFSWDVHAAEGEPFSVRSVPPVQRQTGGRFDNAATSVLYLGEFPEHAVAEVLRQFRGRPLRAAQLRLNELPLALVEVTVPGEILDEVPDLGDPEILLRYGLRADTLALPEAERAITQAVSHTLYAAGLPGFRWWSAIHGGWHSTVLFIDRVPLDLLGFGSPVILDLEHPAVIAAARELRML
jgi:hypothetical protein